MQVDTVDLVARDLLPRLRAVRGARRHWPAGRWHCWPTGTAATADDLPQPLIFNAWMQRLYHDILVRAGVPAGSAAAAAAPWTALIPSALGPDGGVLCGGDCAALLPVALEQAIADLAARFGPDPAAWRWGAAHQVVFAHPLLARAAAAAAGLPRCASPRPATIPPCSAPACGRARSRPRTAPRSAASTTWPISTAACSWSRPASPAMC